MLRLLNVAAIIFMVCTIVADAQQKPLSIGGVPVNANAWPTVSLHGPSPSYEFKCTGTLISNLWVLTARHCVQERIQIDGATISQNDIVVFRGTNDLKNLANPLSVVKIVPCKQANGCPGAVGDPYKDGDLALLQLRDPINPPIAAQVIPLQQPTETQYSRPGQLGLSIVSVGWGQMTPIGSACATVATPDKIFNQVDLELLDDQQCNKAIVNAVIKSKIDDVYCKIVAPIDMKLKADILNEFRLRQSQVNKMHVDMKLAFDNLSLSSEYENLLASMAVKSLLDDVFNEIRRLNPNPRHLRLKNTLCAAKIGKTSCHGDSGGPLVATIGNERRQIGIVTAGISGQCADPNYPHLVPGFYQHVGHFHKWIDSQRSVAAAGRRFNCAIWLPRAPLVF